MYSQNAGCTLARCNRPVATRGSTLQLGDCFVEAGRRIPDHAAATTRRDMVSCLSAREPTGGSIPASGCTAGLTIH